MHLTPESLCTVTFSVELKAKFSHHCLLPTKSNTWHTDTMTGQLQWLSWINNMQSQEHQTPKYWMLLCPDSPSQPSFIPSFHDCYCEHNKLKTCLNNIKSGFGIQRLTFYRSTWVCVRFKNRKICTTQSLDNFNSKKLLYNFSMLI